ncbi:threonylcarbamoyl-AMP synthase [Aureibaculum sp. A20]|uniref:L-threonylcarbamoyladenylate synthase n=1 Tax=Aureibaculum flavum TaxID=2795986 RepID=A0ABS0WUX7_9FLAO|nr:L-threonylcarbamoyladenylate synthase [Aureibaculum flavum]MBJ2175784.1 threonylcarbamoyl-AMP synthase [Aureibaculum flavum]
MKQEIKNSLAKLKLGGTILYPTDTVWGLGCDATNEKAVSRIFEIKKRNESKSLVILVDGIEMLKKYVSDIPEKVVEILNTSERPTTIIYNHPVGLAKNVIAKDNTVAIRIVKHDFCQNIISTLGNPLVSTSANISGMPTPNSFEEIDQSILEAVDYVVNLQLEKITTIPSRIIKISDNGAIVVIRD